MAKKYGTLKCRTCGRTIRYKIKPKYIKRNKTLDPNRLVYIRRHYAKYHPKKWKEIIRKAVAKRKRKR